MPIRPEIFISAASRDLKSCRQLVRDALLTLGCVPVVQDHFPPGEGEVRAMLRARIAACHAVIHLAGECYGYEPQERTATGPRRSYTQLEYDIARELGKPLYTFLCAPDFPYDAHAPEPEDLRQLQDAHRAALSAGDTLYVPLKNPQELDLRVRELQTRVETLSRDLQKTRSWLGRGVAVMVGVLLLMAGLLYGVQRQNAEGRRQADEHASKAEQQLAALQSQLQQQTRLISLVSEKLDRNGPGKGDPAAAAREETARELGIGKDEFEKKLAGENSGLHALYAQVAAGSAAAGARTAEWRKLQRDTLTKLADAEQAAGHYAASLDPYRQALVLADKQREPLLWSEAADDFVMALSRMGRDKEAEPLAREVLDQRTALQGGDAPGTLRSLNNLAIVLEATGNYPEAEALARRCLEARERTLGKEHPNTLHSVDRLAAVLFDKGDRAGAETLDRRALEARERTLGKDDPDTLHSVMGLGNVLDATGDFIGAEALYRRVLEIREHTLGPEHPETLQSLLGLANALDDKGDHAGAEALYRRALETQERTLGPEHPETLASVNNLAAALRAKGDYAGAEPLYRRCLEASERILGKAHPDTALVAYNLSLLEQHLDNPRAALPLAEEALAASKASLPENHPYRRYYEQNLERIQAHLAVADPEPGTPTPTRMPAQSTPHPK